MPQAMFGFKSTSSKAKKQVGHSSFLISSGEDRGLPEASLGLRELALKLVWSHAGRSSLLWRSFCV
jgi:hypothetical protein